MKVAALQLHLVGLDPGQVQHVVDDGQQVLRSARHLVHALGLLGRGGVAPHQVVQADDGVHGGADLVAHVGHEAALGLVGRVGLSACRSQLLGAVEHQFLQVVTVLVELVAQALDRGHIAHHQMDGRLVTVADGSGLHLDIEQRAVLPDQLHLGHRRRRRARPDVDQPGQMTDALLGRKQIDDRLAHQSLGRAGPEQRHRRGVDVDQPAAPVHGHGFGGGLDQRAVTLLAFLHLRLGALAFAGVGQHDAQFGCAAVVERAADGQLGPERTAGAVEHAQVAGRRAAGLHQLLALAVVGVLVDACDEAGQRLREQSAAGHAQQRGGGQVGLHDQAVVGHGAVAHRRQFVQIEPALAGCFELVFGPAQFFVLHLQFDLVHRQFVQQALHGLGRLCLAGSGLSGSAFVVHRLGPAAPRGRHLWRVKGVVHAAAPVVGRHAGPAWRARWWRWRTSARSRSPGRWTPSTPSPTHRPWSGAGCSRARAPRPG